jgi:act minimal PKS acyl carrier protein
MEEFTLEDLRRTLRECAGEDEQVTPRGDLLDRSFEELGYDSIALMTTTSKIELELDVRLPEGEVEFTDTLRDYLAFVNERLAAAQVRGSR